MMRPAGKKPAAGTIGRRELVRSVAALCLMQLPTACGPSVAAAPGGPALPSEAAAATRAKATATARARGRFGGPVEVYSWFDLPDEPRSRELSGIAWDDATRTLWAVQDETANIVPLVPDAKLEKWGFGPVIVLKMSFPLDLEGIVITPDGFIVSSEKGPRVLEVDRAGKLRRDIPLPTHFSKARDNKSLESLSMSPDGRYLFTTSEAALSCDGANATTSAGTRVRILRTNRDGGEPEEHAYSTDPLPHDGGDYGVADLAAISADDILVLERGWARGSGNTARIYRVSLADPVTSCLAKPELSADVPVLPKYLVADLAKVPANGLPASKQKQESPLLDNYEGVALGPVLPDGRQSLILVSDDNARSDQFARIVVLAVG
ncbi:MAG: hypothetical protein JWO86_5086 [Myxococcaceae bacterium]|nr:hypothetical protein [Myxococcaceae bacterium]